jgi:hypothetical protein
MTLTWSSLLQLEPDLRQWEVDAKSAARHARWNWYPKWIPAFQPLRMALLCVAERHGLDVGEVRAVAVAALVDVYEGERRRQQKRPR